MSQHRPRERPFKSNSREMDHLNEHWRAKLFAAQVNEVLAKVLLWNLSCIVHAIEEFGVEAESRAFCPGYLTIRSIVSRGRSSTTVSSSVKSSGGLPQCGHARD